MKIESEQDRLMGFDLFRFFGTWLVFAGHIMLMVFSVYICNGKDAFFNTQWVGRYYSPHIINSFWFTSVVPMFIIISGFFSLRKKAKPDNDEWKSAVKGFYKYWVYTFKWLLVSLVLSIIYANVSTAYNPLLALYKDKPRIEWVLALIKDIISFTEGTTVTWVALLYFVFALGLLQLIAPLFRPLFEIKNVKTIRYILIILFIGTFISPSIRSIGIYMVNSGNDSQLAVFLSNFSVLKTVLWEWPTFWIFYFLFGGLIAVDKEFQNLMKNLSYKKIAILVLTCILLEGINSKIIHMEDSYTTMMAIPQILVLIIISWKLNFIIKANSKIGAIINKYSKDMLGVMTIGSIVVWIFTKDFWQQLYNVVGVFWIQDNIFAGVVTMLWFFIVSLLSFIVITILVHYVSKIPLVGRMMKL